jgi:hypothetical protein
MKKGNKSTGPKKTGTKLSKKQAKVVENLDNEIEELDLSEMSPNEIEKVVKSFSEEGVKLRRARKEIRYQLYRLQSEANGISTAKSTKKFINAFESQPLFGGWRFFTITWDVAFDDPMRIVHKDKSALEEWNELVKAKFPTIDHNGKVSYPDINVRKKMEAYLKK